jgi:hypothetical protein
MKKSKYVIAVLAALLFIFGINSLFFRTEIYDIPVYLDIRITVDHYCQERNTTNGECIVLFQGGTYYNVQRYTINHGLNVVTITYKEGQITKKVTINYADKRLITIRLVASVENYIEVR